MEITRRSAMSLMAGALLTPLMKWPDLSRPILDDHVTAWRKLARMTDSSVFLNCRLSYSYLSLIVRDNLILQAPKTEWAPPITELTRVNGFVKTLKCQDWHPPETIQFLGAQLHINGGESSKFHPSVINMMPGDALNMTYSFEWTACGFVSPTPGYAPCTRETGHTGPCAHHLES